MLIIYYTSHFFENSIDSFRNPIPYAHYESEIVYPTHKRT